MEFYSSDAQRATAVQEVNTRGGNEQMAVRELSETRDVISAEVSSEY